MKLKSSCLAVESTKVSILGSGQLSFGHALLRSVKSTHILHFPLFFLTMTTFASQSGQYTSQIKPASSSFLTSSATALSRSCVNTRFFCRTGEESGLTFSLWTITDGSIPGMSSKLLKMCQIYPPLLLWFVWLERQKIWRIEKRVRGWKSSRIENIFSSYVFSWRDEKLFCLAEEKSRKIKQVVYINLLLYPIT